MEQRLAAILTMDMAGYSRLIEADEMGTLERQKKLRRDLIDPSVQRLRGHIIKNTGDGLIADFPSVRDAVQCAVDIQTEMRSQEQDAAHEARIRYRIGINLGDVVFDDDDVFGDGVNVAARMEALAEPGGICVSDIVQQSIADQMRNQFRDMGTQRVKNINRRIRTWHWSIDAPDETEVAPIAEEQSVRFCASADGTTIAWAATGSGPPVLRAPHWLNHLEFELQNPIMREMPQRFSRDHRLVRFDQRGNGLSDHEVARIDSDAMIEDMEAVVASAGLDRFALLGSSQGAAFSLMYAMRHPEQITCLVLYGGYVRGRLARNDPEEVKLFNTAGVMIREGWGSDLPIYRNFFTDAFLADAPQDVRNSFDELQRITISPENALRVYQMNGGIDIPAAALAGLNVPTLVVHTRDERVVPVAEGRLMARRIPNARFVELPGMNHILARGDPNLDRLLDLATPFIQAHAE
jgi:class 3 adenylate cyclase/pimeloyl-ACP methyl ester carboxylesterase